MSDQAMLTFLRDAIVDTERLRLQSQALIAETLRLLELTDRIASPRIDENKGGG